VLLFVVAFALSTDYGVFLFARIKEGHDMGLSTRDAVAQGLERTGRLITAAALLLCCWWAPQPLRRLHARIGLRESAIGEARA